MEDLILFSNIDLPLAFADFKDEVFGIFVQQIGIKSIRKQSEIFIKNVAADPHFIGILRQVNKKFPIFSGQGTKALPQP